MYGNRLMMLVLQLYVGHSVCHGNFFFVPKYGNAGNGVYMFGSM